MEEIKYVLTDKSAADNKRTCCTTATGTSGFMQSERQCGGQTTKRKNER